MFHGNDQRMCLRSEPKKADSEQRIAHKIDWFGDLTTDGAQNLAVLTLAGDLRKVLDNQLNIGITRDLLHGHTLRQHYSGAKRIVPTYRLEEAVAQSLLIQLTPQMSRRRDLSDTAPIGELIEIPVRAL
jgi:hypothetical protein